MRKVLGIMGIAVAFPVILVVVAIEAACGAEALLFWQVMGSMGAFSAAGWLLGKAR